MKKKWERILAVLAAVGMSLTSLTMPTPPAPAVPTVYAKDQSYVPGDVNLDGGVSILDAAYAVQLAAESGVALEDTSLSADNADVDCSGQVDAVDADNIIQFCIDIATSIPWNDDMNVSKSSQKVALSIDKVELDVADVQAMGYKVPVTVRLTGAPDITSFEFGLTVPTSVKDVSAESDLSLFQSAAAGNVIWVADALSDPIKGDTDVFTLELTLPDTAAPGDTFAVTYLSQSPKNAAKSARWANRRTEFVDYDPRDDHYGHPQVHHDHHDHDHRGDLRGRRQQLGLL